MLTQKQIDIIRSRDCLFSGELDELLDMAETLLAVQWAQDTEYYCQTCQFHCDQPKHCFGGAYNCAYNNYTPEQTLAAYRDAQKIKGVE